ncbi:hypothetical protein [Aureimonas phyllosphaerae]|uniref:Nucleoside 2-deoxyribosyltransferase n=1 Tax=Aureimonas phyllosphaerae TaxID=1166078 RepID=A0A7W6FW31_9HYPH|nr:hypothetical protein [Aureimonas phyllosphaerae]MBB3937788.1 hypothetical protein [Aureimonas phyllosphaerae]MBB3961677.1 hypothetical protein [Aureimonas phyllosphaerae]SFF60564.1 hypothetical protein SAMN05216566_1518 [Aureimonas phyllosphaerae]
MAKDAETPTGRKSAETPKICFVMMPISDVDGYPAGHFREVYAQLIEPAVTQAGYECSLATSTNSAHMIHLDVVTKVATADLCICDMSTNNPNVMFEYGIRQAFDKPTVLIRDSITTRIFDVNGFRDITYDHTLRIGNILSARASITKAIEETVAGNADGSQVFSLVKLMQITKAAMPSGDLSPDDARFALLERKLDAIVQAVTPEKIQQPRNLVLNEIANWVDMDKTPSMRVGKTTISFNKNSITVRPGGGMIHRFANMASLEGSDFWKSLSPTAQNDIVRSIATFSPDFSSF